MARVPGFLPPMSETWIEFPAPSFVLAKPQLCWASWR